MFMHVFYLELLGWIGMREREPKILWLRKPYMVIDLSPRTNYNEFKRNWVLNLICANESENRRGFGAVYIEREKKVYV